MVNTWVGASPIGPSVSMADYLRAPLYIVLPSLALFYSIILSILTSIYINPNNISTALILILKEKLIEYGTGVIYKRIKGYINIYIYKYKYSIANNFNLIYITRNNIFKSTGFKINNVYLKYIGLPILK